MSLNNPTVGDDRFKDMVVYQIYTRSFKDSNGDGIGDFNGIIEKIDYLQWLGVDVLWLSPFCRSPNRDNGYDVSDYRDVTEEFGSLEDLNRLIDAVHERGMLIMMDLVMNHSSVEHPWFREKPEYYYWTDKPNNWDSYFSDRAWTWDEERGQYYLHHFYPEQPDLNWENPEVRREMHEIARFWISRGIDAFRLDAIHHIGKPEGLPDAPEPKTEGEFRNFRNTSRTHRYLREFRRAALSGSRAFTVGETGGTTPRTSRRYVDRSREELDMIFLFDHFWVMDDDMRRFPELIRPVYRSLHHQGWNTLFFSNHDTARQLSIFGDENYRGPSATTLAAFLLTMWGTPFVYQGEEIGMTNANFPTLDDYDCAAAKNLYYRELEAGRTEAQAFTKYSRRTRDNTRTAMQWDASENAGFSEARPWLGVVDNYRDVNVAAQKGRPGSILENYRFLISLRKRLAVLRRGGMSFPGYRRGRSPVTWLRSLSASDAASFSGSNDLAARRALIISNPQSEAAVWQRPFSLRGGRGDFRLVYSNLDPGISGEQAAGLSFPAEVKGLTSLTRRVELSPWETRIYLAE